MKTQIYNDGNKRTAVVYANHYLISKGQGLLVIDYSKVDNFKKHLVNYYENKDLTSIKSFLKNVGWNSNNYEKLSLLTFVVSGARETNKTTYNIVGQT